MDLDLRLVRYFVVVADELHFGRAAARLHISQPALSKQIRRLESDLGFRLLTRDSRHVALTPDGARFLRDARVLIAHATRMTRAEDAGIRIAHIFDLDTSRLVVDAFAARFPDVAVIASSMDSQRQLDALMNGLLDVAILRVTPGMTAAHPEGWRHRPLRLEPFRLVGRRGERECATVSLNERPIEVFGDPRGSALFNAHGEYLSAFESDAALTLSWLGNPGTFDQCLARMERAPAGAYLLEFDSYAQRYRRFGMPLHHPAELQPVYPWSIAWRDEPLSAATAAFLAVAADVAAERRWLEPDTSAPLWQPPSAEAVRTLR
ncbi:LysR family transcriptional regulator [Microbacterium kyungheense]|uniref:DNA-binding transcriptional LysR family regulator n=1 Tax=Microbacterium kyungheense TaxID=1263636 RepID=A0A543FLX1_9MICO|nr:LysR family transcriptional regulator [Microbacterium kyungheense]TQM34860.1 DNA-binding transcriptional LysR family regulator [Microbacterium kyungheense]